MIQAQQEHRQTMSEFERECAVYCEHLNELLACYGSDLQEYLPLEPYNMLERLRDGVLLAHVLHYHSPESIQLNKLVRGLDMQHISAAGNQAVVFEATANLNRVMEAAKKMRGQLVVVNLGSEDVLEMRADLVLGLVWQLIRAQLLSKVNLTSHPELVRLLQPGESLAALAGLRPEPLLLRWFNYHLDHQGVSIRVHSLSRDIVDGEAYLRLIAAITKGSDQCLDNFDLEAALQLGPSERLAYALTWAQAIGCPCKIRVSDMLAGHPRLNMAFIASLFNSHVGIHLPSEEELALLRNELAGLRRRVSELDDQLSYRPQLQEQIQKLEGEKTQLQSQLSMMHEDHQSQLAAIQQDFDQCRQELAAQYQESLEAALGSERRLHQQEMAQVKATLKDSRRKAQQHLSELAQSMKPSILDGTKVGQALSRHAAGEDRDASLEHLIQLQAHLSRTLAEQCERQQEQLAVLRAEIEHKERIEDVMAAKVREYSEQLIAMSAEAEEEPKQLSALATFRTKTLPAIRRALACQGH